jgi:hypothetical protein
VAGGEIEIDAGARPSVDVVADDILVPAITRWTTAAVLA